jgi:CubicO group peptidase (beta-lactamase class C family)
MPYETFMQTRLFDPLGMVDTTFWPNAEQLTRLAKNYQPAAETQELEETQIQFLQYPLNNPQRKPMPAGGLFSTADDIARFCQMFLNSGEFNGKRYISEAAVHEMTRVQSPDTIQEKVGLAWYIDGSSYAHGGACSTNMSIHPDHNRAVIYMVQHSGFAANGANAGSEFRKAALEA